MAAECALELLPIFGRRGNAGQRLHHGVQDHLDRRVKRTRHLIMHPHAIPPHVDQTGPPEIREVPRDGRLPHSKAVVMLASLGCGNPTALAELKPGEVVLDLDSGGDKLTRAGLEGVDLEPTRVYRADEARQFLGEAGLSDDSVLQSIDGRFMSAFVRAQKPPADRFLLIMSDAAHTEIAVSECRAKPPRLRVPSL
jgi:hypothetical protein